MLVDRRWLFWAPRASCCAFTGPGWTRPGNALRPQRGEAETALEEITAEMGLPQDPLWLIISGKDEREVVSSA